MCWAGRHLPCNLLNALVMSSISLLFQRDCANLLPPAQDDPFGDEAAPDPAAPEAAEGEAEAAQPAEQAAEQEQDEEDEWGDDPFAAAPAPAAAELPPEAASTSHALAGLSLADSSQGGSEVAAAGRRLVLDVLAATANSQDAAVQLPALAALCTFLQRQQQQAASASAQQAQQLSWALQCTAAALPGAAAQVHAFMSTARRLEEAETQVGWVVNASLGCANSSLSTAVTSQGSGVVSM